MSLTSAMARFVDAAELIRSRAEHDIVLRDLCEDYHLARTTLSRLKKQKPRASGNIKEYATLVDDLEEEIIRYLVDANGRTRQ